MIEETTKQALLRLGFSHERAAELSEGSISTKTIINDNHIVIDGRTNKIYSEIDGAKKYYFENGNIEFPTKVPSLFNEYYNLKLERYIKENEALNLPQSVLAKEFYDDEVVRTFAKLQDTKDKFKVSSKDPAFTKPTQRYLNWLEEYNPAEPKIKPVDFLDFIQNVKDKKAFALELKETFNIEVGANLKIMLELLSEENIIVLSDSQLKSFHEAMKVYFNRDIKSYEALRKAKDFTPIATDKINAKLKPLINRHKA
ncbi:hypothetical protein [Flavobacterium sp. WC2416]|uniref:Uncharacterized protein n=1 Tax=Flavobacterium sp. WC2416 TaxID=3234141 RepID=A0AB39W900_9FLAO